MTAQDLVTVDTQLTPAEAGALAKREIAVGKERAKVVAELIDQGTLYKKIGTKKFVFVDGWTTLAKMYGLTPDIEWTQDLAEGGHLARARLMREDGTVASSAEAECGGASDGEWATRDAPATRSMAQTRAVSKVCRLALSWVMVLAGYSGTPAEEMNGGNGKPAPRKPLAQVDQDTVYMKPRQDALTVLLKDRVDNDGWDAVADICNISVPGSFKKVNDRWALMWANIDSGELDDLIQAMTPHTGEEVPDAVPDNETEPTQGELPRSEGEAAEASPNGDDVPE